MKISELKIGQTVFYSLGEIVYKGEGKFGYGFHEICVDADDVDFLFLTEDDYLISTYKSDMKYIITKIRAAEGEIEELGKERVELTEKYSDVIKRWPEKFI